VNSDDVCSATFPANRTNYEQMNIFMEELEILQEYPHHIIEVFNLAKNW